MAVVPRRWKSGITYWIAFTWQKKRVWERVGRDKRAAERLDAQRKREVKAGTYEPLDARRSTTFGQYLKTWTEKRKTRNADNEAAAVARYVLPLKWLADVPLVDVRPKHMIRMVEELGAVVSETTGKPLSSKTLANVYGTVRTAMRDAVVRELAPVDPCVLPQGTLNRGARATVREPYPEADVVTLVTAPDVPIDARVWNTIAFFTGEREGEVCGHRWSDLSQPPQGLACLTVERQYDGQVLKTERPRRVPVHPVLARVLAAWWSFGFELVHMRKPTPDDPIVPTRAGHHHTKSTAYKAWRRACVAAGVTNRTLHASRHTFISLARRNGARKEVLERITHNAAGDIVDHYTKWDWAPLCEAVLCFPVDADVDAIVGRPLRLVEAPGIEDGATRETSANVVESSEPEPPPRRLNSASSNIPDADCAAGQQTDFESASPVTGSASQRENEGVRDGAAPVERGLTHELTHVGTSCPCGFDLSLCAVLAGPECIAKNFGDPAEHEEEVTHAAATVASVAPSHARADDQRPPTTATESRDVTGGGRGPQTPPVTGAARIAINNRERFEDPISGEYLYRLVDRAAVKVFAQPVKIDTCRGAHPPTYDEAAQLFVCARGCGPLDPSQAERIAAGGVR